MNKHFWIIISSILVCMLLAVALGLKYSQAAIVFGIAAAIMAPFAIHRVPDSRFAASLIIALAYFASFPVKKLYNLDGVMPEAVLALIYAAVLWLIGLGWKRSWKPSEAEK